MNSIIEKLWAQSQAKMAQSPSPDFSAEIVQLVSLQPADITNGDDAASAIHLLAILIQGRPAQITLWNWARNIAAPHPHHGIVISFLASLGDQLRAGENSPLKAVIQPAELETMLRHSVELAPDDAGCFARAGTYFLNVGNDAEAARYFARSADLDPASSFVALRLAEIYTRSNRLPDALTTLDRCVRKGSADRDVFWQASLLASTLGRHEQALVYLDQLEKTQPGAKWVQYYRSAALLDLKRYTEAAAAIEQEAARINIPTALHVHTIRAAAAAGLNDIAAVRHHINAAVDTPLSIVNYLSRASVMSCYIRLWSATLFLPTTDRARLRLTDRLLSSGLTPAAFWDQQRESGEKINGLNHYWCEVHQAVNAKWASDGHALPGQERWKSYRIQYGVLAIDESDARRQVMQWQSQSANLPSQISSVTFDGGPFVDRPGVTQRGYAEEMTNAQAPNPKGKPN